jgi:hypothetical protein
MSPVCERAELYLLINYKVNEFKAILIVVHRSTCGERYSGVYSLDTVLSTVKVVLPSTYSSSRLLEIQREKALLIPKIRFSISCKL